MNCFLRSLPCAAASSPATIARWSRTGGLALAAVRVGLGAAAIAAPSLAGRAWIGEGATGRDRAVVLRALGGRDIALGAGALLGAGDQDELRRWVAMGAASDLVDTVATSVGFGALPQKRRWLVLGACAGAALTGALVVAALGHDAS